MQAGNAHYRQAADIPELVAMFPLPAALLLPGGRLPLNIFEPRYLALVDHALAGSRLVGVIQPDLKGELQADGRPQLCEVGCAGRIVSFAESGDGRYLISLHGVCRFRVMDEIEPDSAFRQCRIVPFEGDLEEDPRGPDVDRPSLLRAFRAYLDANGLEADWDNVSRAPTGVLVNALSMMAPYGPAEKQALLEAPDVKARAETLIALTEIELARRDDADNPGRLQ